MSELITPQVESEPEGDSLGKRILRGLTRALIAESPDPAPQQEPQARGTWRGNLLYDEEGNIVATRNSDGIVF